MTTSSKAKNSAAEAAPGEENVDTSDDAIRYAAERLSFARPGELPVRPSNFVGTTAMGKDIDFLLKMTVRLGGCTLVGGPIGIGKTTAISESARRLNTEAVYVNMFGTTNHVQQLGVIWEAVSGTKAEGTAPQIQQQILDLLLRKPMILLIDDSHRAHRTALHSILAVFDKFYSQRGRGTPIVLCGNNLERHIKMALPELLSRAHLAKDFAPLAGQPLVDLVMSMDSRIEGTKPEDIRALDSHRFLGDLRRWRQFFEILDLHRDGETEPRPLTEDEVKDVVGLMPMSTR